MPGHHTSLPSRERGLKYSSGMSVTYSRVVAPFAGAWIEILYGRLRLSKAKSVAPFAGAWIEIARSGGLYRQLCVAPFAGAWIEMSSAVCS